MHYISKWIFVKKNIINQKENIFIDAEYLKCREHAYAFNPNHKSLKSKS